MDLSPTQKKFFASCVFTFFSAFSSLLDLQDHKTYWGLLKWPPATLFIVSAQLIIFIIDRSTPTRKLTKLLKYDAFHKFQIYRLFTYGFVHNDWYSLFQNIQVQLLLGRPVEIYLTWHGYSILYILALFVGSCIAYSYRTMFVSGSHVPSALILAVHSCIMTVKIYFSDSHLRSYEFLVHYTCFAIDVLIMLKMAVENYDVAFQMVAGLATGFVAAAALFISNMDVILHIEESPYRLSIVVYFWYFCIFKLNAFLYFFFQKTLGYSLLIIICVLVSLVLILPFLEEVFYIIYHYYVTENKINFDVLKKLTLEQFGG